MELKELNERQRADHADKMYHILKGIWSYISSGLRNGVQLWRVVANILNKQSWTSDKGWFSSFAVGRGANDC
jgi:hypothetical protein